MSYRSDLYSRRPTEDDRRASDSRDRRRDSFSRGGSDGYKDERYRRDADSSTRDRRSPLEFHRDYPPVPVTKAAKPPTRAPSARSDYGTRTRSSSLFHTEDTAVDKKTAVDKFLSICDAVATVANLRTERDALDKALKQRQAEYERSMVKHAEFPSVPEVQNMHRVKYSDRVRLLDTQIQKAQDEINESAEVVVTAMFSAAPAQDSPRDAEAKVADSADSLQQQEVAKKQQAEISELKSKVRKMEAKHTQDISELKAEFSRQFAEMNRQMEELGKGMRKDEAKALTSLKEEVKGGMEEAVKEVKRDIIKEVKAMQAAEGMEQIRAMRSELDKRQSEQETDLQSRLSKHREELAKTVEEKLAAQQNSSEPNSTLDPSISTLIQQESLARQSEITGLIRRVDEQHGQLVQHTQEIAAVRGSQATCAQQVEEHESKLARIDTDALEDVAETVSIKFPKLQRAVAGIQATLNQTTENLRGVDVPNLQRMVVDMQTRLDDIPREVDRRQHALNAQVREVVKGMGDLMGSMVDNVEVSVTEHGKRIKALEEVASVGRLASDTGRVQAADGEFDSTGVASFKPDYDMTKATVERLTQESESINGQLEMLRQSFTGLDSQFNNLTTRALAECIIGHLEQLYPNSRQLSADVDGLKTATLGLNSRVVGLEGLLQGFKGKADGFADVELYAAKVSSMQGSLLKDIDESTRPGNKRKRSDLGTNGTGNHPMGNGTDPTSGRM